MVGKLEQDYFRRVVLREHGGIGAEAVAPSFIDMCVRRLLGAGYQVIVEGILHTGSYGPMLRQLIGDHLGPSHAFYLDVGFEETVRRHHNRAEPIPVTAAQMLDWYAEHDVLGCRWWRVRVATAYWCTDWAHDNDSDPVSDRGDLG
jgi:hypothetical protein